MLLDEIRERVRRMVHERELLSVGEADQEESGN
jgi:hypothetical protein